MDTNKHKKKVIEQMTGDGLDIYDIYSICKGAKSSQIEELLKEIGREHKIAVDETTGILTIGGAEKAKPITRKRKLSLTENQKKIYDIVSNRPITKEQIAKLTKSSPTRTLNSLVKAGVIEQTGLLYKIKH